jgi:hypothetical protein
MPQQISETNAKEQTNEVPAISSDEIKRIAKVGGSQSQ